MSQNPAFDPSIPVLTEVFNDMPPAQTETHAALGFSGEQWSVLERQVTERVLQQLQNRVDFVLEQRVRDSMAEVLQHALAGLTEEIRAGLQQTIEQIVVRAVAQEVAHLQTIKK